MKKPHLPFLPTKPADGGEVDGRLPESDPDGDFEKPSFSTDQES